MCSKLSGYILTFQHPAKNEAVQDLVTKASNIFSPDETEQQDHLEFTTLTAVSHYVLKNVLTNHKNFKDPVMTSVDANLVS
jgi:hypothetical protein